jgi:hypothetical protein
MLHCYVTIMGCELKLRGWVRMQTPSRGCWVGCRADFPAPDRNNRSWDKCSYWLEIQIGRSRNLGGDNPTKERALRGAAAIG